MGSAAGRESSEPVVGNLYGTASARLISALSIAEQPAGLEQESSKSGERLRQEKIPVANRQYPQRVGGRS